MERSVHLMLRSHVVFWVFYTPLHPETIFFFFNQALLMKDDLEMTSIRCIWRLASKYTKCCHWGPNVAFLDEPTSNELWR
jgi:hypothetical protein